MRGGHMSPAWASFILPSLAGAPAGWCPEWCATWTCDGSAWCLNGEQPQPCIDCPTGMEPGWSQDWLQDGGASALAKDGKLAAQEFSLHWRAYPGTNCWWGGNGAESEIEEPRGSAAPTIHSLTECKAACLAAFPACGGLLYLPSEDKCFRKGQITISECHGDAELELHVLQRPSPPSPPLPPPLPPHRPVGRGVDALNEQFRNGRPSGRLEEVHMHACAHARMCTRGCKACCCINGTGSRNAYAHARICTCTCMHACAHAGGRAAASMGRARGMGYTLADVHHQLHVPGRVHQRPDLFDDRVQGPEQAPRQGGCVLHTRAYGCMYMHVDLFDDRVQGPEQAPRQGGYVLHMCAYVCSHRGAYGCMCTIRAPLTPHACARVCTGGCMCIRAHMPTCAYTKVGICAYVCRCLHVHMHRWVSLCHSAIAAASSSTHPTLRSTVYTASTAPPTISIAQTTLAALTRPATQSEQVSQSVIS